MLTNWGARPKLADIEEAIELTCENVPIPKRATKTPEIAKKIAKGFHFAPFPR